MKPKDWSRENFTPDRLASATTCLVWFDPDQEKGKHYNSWRDDLFKLEFPNKKPIYVVSQPRGFKQLKQMLEDFINPMSRTYKPDGFVKAEIYENFTGQMIFNRTMTTINDSSTDRQLFELKFRTDETLKQPGKHRLLDSIQSGLTGAHLIDRELMRTHLIHSWRFWMANHPLAPMKQYNAAEIEMESKRQNVIPASDPITERLKQELREMSQLVARLKAKQNILQ